MNGYELSSGVSVELTKHVVQRFHERIDGRTNSTYDEIRRHIETSIFLEPHQAKKCFRIKRNRAGNRDLYAYNAAINALFVMRVENERMITVKTVYQPDKR